MGTRLALLECGVAGVFGVGVWEVVDSRQLPVAVGGRQLAVGRRKPFIANCPVQTGNWQRQSGRKKH